MTGLRFHLLSILAVILGLIFFFSDISRVSYVRSMVSAINQMVAPVVRLKEETVTKLREELSIYLHNVEVAKENVRLKRKLSSLILTERELSACLTELEKMERKLRASSGLRKLRYVMSRILYYDPTGFDLFVIIEGGRDKGIREGDLVVTERSVVGFVESVFGSTSRVITTYNEKFSTTAIVGGRGKRYIYRGGFPEGSLLHVSLEDDVKVGEEVYLVGVRKKIPPFLIGRIKEVSRGKDPFFKEVRVEPEAVPREEDYVFVIRRSP